MHRVDGWRMVPRSDLEPVCGALAGVIRLLRVGQGLSLAGLALRTGLSRQMLSLIEKRRRVPSLDSVARISRALGRPLSGLLQEAEQAARVGEL